MQHLREGLLNGRVVALAGGRLNAVREQLLALGGEVTVLEGDLDEERCAEWARVRAPSAIVYDAGPEFGEGGADRLQACIERGWVVTRAVATGTLIPAGRGGKVLLIAPRRRAGLHAEAARAGLENLARTLSVEWARYAITAVTIAPGDETSDEEVAHLVAFLASPAGDYYSGCRFSLGVVA
jgi:NAD(P)-dependent dehydrogenase (short-subunit alcohol dehydrogenase family)